MYITGSNQRLTSQAAAAGIQAQLVLPAAGQYHAVKDPKICWAYNAANLVNTPGFLILLILRESERRIFVKDSYAFLIFPCSNLDS